MTHPLILAPEARARLSKLVGMFGSSSEGERAVAALKATQLLHGVGATWADLVESLPVQSAVVPIHFATRPETRRAAEAMRRGPEPCSLLRRWQKTARMVAAYPEMLNERELDFVRDIAVRRDEPTVKQTDWLNNLAARVESRMAA